MAQDSHSSRSCLRCRLFSAFAFVNGAEGKSENHSAVDGKVKAIFNHFIMASGFSKVTDSISFLLGIRINLLLSASRDREISICEWRREKNYCDA